MKIGKKVAFVQIDLDYLLPEAIEIGDDSTIGWKAKLMTHEFTQDFQRYGEIIIGKTFWLEDFLL